MTTPLGAAAFFALEAGECLDRLETLVSQPGSPSADEFLRTARVLRGSALMAAQTQIARAAAGLEADLENLAAGAGGGLVVQAPAAQERPELHTGVRAFVAREGALIASALDRAARALRTTPEDREPLYNVIRRMQSLRGLAELGDLNPLPEILDGIELAVGDLTRLFAPPPGVAEVMDAAAGALTRISRDVAEHGRPDPNAEEPAHFTELLLRAFAVERDVVPIEDLYFEGDTTPISRST